MCERQAFEQNKHKGNNNGAFTNARCVELSLWWMEITFKSLCKFLHTGWMCVLKYSCKMVRVDPFFNNQTPSFFIAFNTTTIKKKIHLLSFLPSKEWYCGTIPLQGPHYVQVLFKNLYRRTFCKTENSSMQKLFHVKWHKESKKHVFRQDSRNNSNITSIFS